METKKAIKAGPMVDEAFDVSGTVKGLFRIEGLEYVGDGLFQMDGLRHCQIDWQMMQVAIGLDHPIPDELADTIYQAVWTHSMIRLLAGKIKPA